MYHTTGRFQYINQNLRNPFEIGKLTEKNAKENDFS